MQEIKNKRLFYIMLALIFITMSVILQKKRAEKDQVDPALFRVEDTKSIQHVVLKTKTGTVDLKFTGGHWALNEKYTADNHLIDVLMATLLQVTPHRELASTMQDSVRRILDNTGVVVRLMGADDALIKEFVAGGNDAKTQAWFRLPDKPATYLMTIPGYRVYSSGIFELPENGWREKRVFNFNWRNFRKLTLTYPADPASGFEIERQKDFLGIVGIDNPDSTRLNTFLNDALRLTADDIITRGTSRVLDSLVRTTPFVTITVGDIAQRNYSLTLFGPAPVNGKIAGIGLDGEIVVFERRNTFPLLKKKPYFKAIPGGKF